MDEDIAVDAGASVASLHRAGGGSHCRCCSSSCSRTLRTAGRWRASTRRCASPTAVGSHGAASAVRGWSWARRSRVSGSPPPTSRRSADEPFYDVKVLRTIFIQFPAPNWEALLEPNYRRDVDVPAVVTIDGRTYRDVGVRFRGNSSYRMVPSGFKRSLNLSLDAVHADQAVGGYNTLNLLNANGDPTFVRTILYSEIARQYVAAPKVNFVRVVINGESWGIFVNVQQFNKDFVRESFGTAKGARWKVPGSPRGRGGLEYLGDGIAAYRNLYELKSKESDKAWTDLIRLCRLLNSTAPEDLEAVLAPHLDIDEALKFLALEVVLVNTDGYWTRASDYSIYQEESGRFHVLPYDFNEAMGVESPGRRGGFGPRRADARSARRRRRRVEAAARAAARRAGAARAVSPLRARHRRHVARLESRRTARQGIPGPDRGRRQDRRPQALQRRRVQPVRSRSVLPAAARVPAAVAPRRPPWNTGPTTITIPGSTARRRGCGSFRRCSSASSRGLALHALLSLVVLQGSEGAVVPRECRKGSPTKTQPLKPAAAIRPAVERM